MEESEQHSASSASICSSHHMNYLETPCPIKVKEGRLSLRDLLDANLAAGFVTAEISILASITYSEEIVEVVGDDLLMRYQ